ncbi:ribokinase [Microaerobacter geothermalis]|nr:ribokinase [Microaerobacter geothermalis]
MKRPKVAVVGSINMDLVISSPRIPLAGETILGKEFFTIPGGKGANQAVAASRLGAEVAIIGCVGDDIFGKELLDQLNKEKICRNYVSVFPDVSTGVASITVSEQGENCIVVSPGANYKLTPELVRKGEDFIKEADILLVQLEVPLDAVDEAVRIANEHQVKVILNPAPAKELPQSLLEKIDILTPNETEGKLLTTQWVDSNIDVEEIIRSLQKLGVKNVVITQGGEGVSYNDHHEIKHLPAYQVNVVDTTAAGDSFNAALGISLAEGASLTEAIQFAQKVAALTVTQFGAQTSLPYREQVDQFKGEK